MSLLFTRLARGEPESYQHANAVRTPRKGRPVCPMCGAEMRAATTGTHPILAVLFFAAALFAFVWWPIGSAVLLVISLILAARKVKVQKCRSCGYSYRRK